MIDDSLVCHFSLHPMRVYGATIGNIPRQKGYCALVVYTLKDTFPQNAFASLANRIHKST